MELYLQQQRSCEDLVLKALSMRRYVLYQEQVMGLMLPANYDNWGYSLAGADILRIVGHAVRYIYN